MTTGCADDLISDERYQAAVALFNQHSWYLAHDAFEELWHESLGPMRSILHGIIQVSVAEFHLDNGNLRGSTLLMAEGLNHLSSADGNVLDVDLPSLQTIVRQRLAALQSGVSLDNLPLPHLVSRTSQRLT